LVCFGLFSLFRKKRGKQTNKQTNMGKQALVPWLKKPQNSFKIISKYYNISGPMFRLF
jgi:hypothetical protein